VLLAAGIALLWSLAFRLWGRREAWIATALLCASPFYFFMGQSYLSHLPCAVFLMLALLALHGAALAPTTRRLALWAAGAGAAAGMAFLIRPFSAMLGMAGMGVILVGAFERDWRRIARIVGFAAIGSAWALAALALHNALTTGSPLRMGYSEFSKDFGFLGYGRFRRESVWENFGTNLPFFFTYLNTDLWGGMIPDLCLPALALVVAWRDRMARALAAAALLFVLCHSFYFYFDLFYGPRLAFETLPWLVLLTARGIGALWDRLGALRRAAPARLVAGFVLALWLPSAVALSWPRLLDYYSLNYGGQGRQVRDAVAAKGLHNALVVVRSTSDLAFCTLYNMNPIDIANGDVVFARTPDRRETLSLLREAFPKHEKWVLDVEYEPLAGRNWYPERFRITKLEWARPAAAATPAPSMNQ
jgi:4-amino-4-deoxy-L-arabinose transferase-like glycosyltransferase